MPMTRACATKSIASAKRLKIAKRGRVIRRRVRQKPSRVAQIMAMPLAHLLMDKFGIAAIFQNFCSSI